MENISNQSFSLSSDQQVFDIEKNNVEIQKLLQNLLKYEHFADFKSDHVVIIHSNEIYEMVIENVNATIENYCSTDTVISLEKLKSRLADVIHKLNFKTSIRLYQNGSKHDFDGAIRAAFSKTINNVPKENPDIWLYVWPMPFEPKKSTEEELFVLFKMTNVKNLELRMKQFLEKYTPAVEGKINGKEIDEIYISTCPLIWNETIPEKRNKCCHTVSIYFKDKTCYLNLDHFEFTVDQLRDFGYLPYVRQHRPHNDSDFKKQTEVCELSKMIGSKRFVK